jgi:hypothetical protein
MKTRCFFKGHEHDHDEYGYDNVCKHCGMHDYYDSMQCDSGYGPQKWYDCYEFTIQHWWYIIKFRLKWWVRDYFRKCNDCGKPDKRFGADVGDHSDCLPF